MTSQAKIVLTSLDGEPAQVLFDTADATVIQAGNADGEAHGNLSLVHDRTVALYASEGTLYLQIDRQRWNIADPATDISYAHDLNERMTTFRVDDFVLTYPAWWRDDPSFDPLEPERDEDEDYFGYVHSVSQQPALQASLLRRWNLLVDQ